MARYRSRAPRRNRNRIYTIISLIIIVGIIAYIYIPNRGQSGLITNSNGTRVSTNEGGTSSVEENTNAGGTTMGASTPDWTTPSSGDITSSIPVQEKPVSGLSERITESSSTPATIPAGIEGMATSMQTSMQTGNSEADKLIAQANSLMKQGMSKIIPARDKFNEALRSRTISQSQAQLVKKQLSSLADDWLFNKSVIDGDPLCEHYKVQSGNRLQVIGEKNKVPYEILMTINKISDAKKIQVGQNLKIVKGPFRAVVYRSTYTMDIYLQNTYVRTFKVGLGLPGSETPTGLWKVEKGGKIIEPVWTDPQGKRHYPSDPDYPLGSRWIALEGVSGDAVGRDGFAIHGTHEPQTLGTASSQGCIRLENGAAIMVYNMLIPGYSTVEVVD